MKNYIIDLLISTVSGLLVIAITFLYSYSKLGSKVISRWKNNVKETGNEIRKENELNQSTEEEEATIKNNNQKTKVVNSKDYGVYQNWELRTFYTINKKVFDEYKYIQFNVKNKKNQNFVLKVSEIKDFFGNNIIPDKAGTVKVYANKENPSDVDFKIIRFGQNEINKPIIIKPRKGNLENLYTFQ
ncbi:hypothetical protein M2S00_07280 [Apilactobacillus sp. TMW 2.2459]|uniref:hypothetical protein n=1 Tax=Apilactobacillus xinyiensis TaxID=2841032 RepID=UPI0020102247|nr:hypothetical protein [Apilactobacillus xinyiensis]MCL0312908.1 hypothetical protein [Apilactobacillus xinyiensis]